MYVKRTPFTIFRAWLPIPRSLVMIKICTPLQCFHPSDFRIFLLCIRSTFHLSITLLVRYRSPPLIFSLGRMLPPDLDCTPKQPDSSDTRRSVSRCRMRTGLSPSMVARSDALHIQPEHQRAPAAYNSLGGYPKAPLRILTLGSPRFTRRY